MIEVAAVVIKLAPIVLTIGAVASALKEMVSKYRARAELSKAMPPQDAEEVNRLLNEKDLDAAAVVVRKYIDRLSPKEQSEAESALAQPSVGGRTDYIREVSNSAIRSADHAR